MRRMILAILIAMITVFTFSACAFAETAASDTTNWWDEFINKTHAKVGYIGLDTNHNDNVIEGESGVAWDIAASVPVLQWRKFEVDAGVSKAGVVFGAVTFNVVDLSDVTAVNIPGSDYVTIDAGLFVGKDVDAVDGLDWGDDWVIGGIVNLVGW